MNKGLLGGADISVSGGSTTSNMWLVDGADNVDHGSNRTILVYPSVDAIEEFKIQRNNYGAEFGQAGGAQVNVVTRGGTNTFHGSAYYFARRDSWNSTDYFLKQAGLPRAPLKWDDFGATFGGPIIKDKLHFFLSYEKNMDHRSDVRSGFVPTAAERAGDFSGAPLGDCTPPAPDRSAHGPAVPRERDPGRPHQPRRARVSQALPAPEHHAELGVQQLCRRPCPTPIDWDQINARVDWSISNSTRVMVRYTRDNWKADDTILLGDSANVGRRLGLEPAEPVARGPAQSDLRVEHDEHADVLVLGQRDHRRPDRGRSRGRPGQRRVAHDLPRERQGACRHGPARPSGGAGPYGHLCNFAPWKNNQSLYVLKDDFSAVFGRHFLKAGLFLSTNAKNEDAGPATRESVVFFNPIGYRTPAGFLPGRTSGNPIADLLLRDTVYRTRESKTIRNVSQRWRDLEFYVADSYKVAPRVTLDFGLRFSHLEPPWMADDQQATFALAAVDRALGNSPCNGMEYPPGTNPCPALGLQGGSDAVTRSLVPVRSLWAAPRLGVAWNVTGDGKTAIRGGVGLFYERERVNPGLAMGQNPPFSGFAALPRTLDSAPEVGGAASAYGAPGGALELTEGNAHYWQWNLTVERELFRNTLVELAYVGSRGLGLQGQTNLNEVPPENRLAYARTGDAALRPLNGITGIGGNDLALWQHDRSSIYHGLQAALNSRFGHGSVLALAYTWSKLITTSWDTASGGLDSGLLYTDSTQPGLNRARGANDRTHMFSASLVLALPTFQDKSRFVRNVLGDWEFTTIVQAGSGYPVTVGAVGPGAQWPRGHEQFPAADTQPGRRPALHREHRERAAVAQPGRLHARRLPDWHERQRRSQHLRRPGPVPGGRLALQEHQAGPEGEAPAPLRGVQPLQHGQLPGVLPEHGLQRGERRVRHRERGHGDEDRERDTPGNLRATHRGARPEDDTVGSPPDVLSRPQKAAAGRAGRG